MPVTSCIEEHPSKKTVQIAGRYVSLRKLSAYTGIDHGYLSRGCSEGSETPLA
jgi:hypothetical protein